MTSRRGAPPTPAVSLEVAGMTCASCVRRVEHALTRVDGVAAASVNLAMESAEVALASAVDPALLVEAVRRLGYEAGLAPPHRNLAAEAAQRSLRRRAAVRARTVQVAGGGVLSAAVLLLAYGVGADPHVGHRSADADDSRRRRAGVEIPP